jgi:hypothetical protein
LKRSNFLYPTMRNAIGYYLRPGLTQTPDLRPQSHNREKIQTLGGIYQERGYVRCTVELARSVAMAGGPAPLLAVVDSEKRASIVAQATELFQAVEESGLDLQLRDYQDQTDSMERLMRSLKGSRDRER